MFQNRPEYVEAGLLSIRRTRGRKQCESRLWTSELASSTADVWSRFCSISRPDCQNSDFEVVSIAIGHYS
jgi:hypothetical protein